MRRLHFLTHFLCRSLALFVGGFALCNVLGGWWRPGFDMNLWWIDLRRWPDWLSHSFILAFAGLLIAYTLRPAMSPSRRAVTLLLICIAFIAAMGNTVVYYRLMHMGDIAPVIPVPVTLLVAGVLSAVAMDVWRRSAQPASLRGGWLVIAAGVCMWTAVFPLIQMGCFGYTDYRRDADVAIVFGARVYRDGRCSDALADRVRTACRLYHGGQVHTIIMTGGPGDGDIHETHGMKQLAVSLGVPADAIVLDMHGVNTRSSVESTGELLDRLRVRRVLAVSHAYHLPRIKLTYRRAGREVLTVPATESYTLTAMPYFMAREAAAIWVYYFRPLIEA